MSEALFTSTFGTSPTLTQFTPGRVNLLGEHTDYNGGMVLPTALPMGVTISLSPRTDKNVRIISDKFDDMATRHLSDLSTDHWSDYALGAIKLANDAEPLIGGADIALTTTLPFGAGLSSSAAVIVGILKLCREIAASPLSDTDIAVLARRVENEFIGMPCGIMDQMAVSIARPGQALALDTKKLSYDLIDLPETYHMAVIHSGHFRKLSEGRYKTRKEECDVIKQALGRDDICLLTDKELAALSHMTDAVQRRAKHCATEHRRTVKGAKALQDGDMKNFGELMIASHASMRDDFDITLPAIDILVEDAVRLGAVGARMTGGGFGGCIVACVERTKLEPWTAALLSSNPEAFYVC
ncbi:galactokinase [Fretibacter rubidus]|uniref:galactokinase n=1 Tax=Fretibacter rubidus TaxID=570162 RepID=UPI003529FEB1